MTNTAAEVWQLLGELVNAQKETDRLFKESEHRFQETERIIKEESEKTDRQLQQLSQQVEETSREVKQLSQQSEKTDRQIQELSQEIKQLGREVKRVSQEVGNLGGKWGRFVENMVAPACQTIFTSRGIPVHKVAQRVQGKLNGEILEIDVLVNNENHVLVVEVKSTLSVEDVKEFITDLSQFRQFFPEYNDKQLYGAVAGIEIDKGVNKYAYRQGLFVLGQSGETVTILNDNKFQPKSW